MSTYTFEVLCADCGVVELTCDQLWLVLAPRPVPDVIAFSCPSCGLLDRSEASQGVVALLSELVAVEELDIPAEALEPHSTEPLTTDDLIELMLDLERLGSQPSARDHGCGTTGAQHTDDATHVRTPQVASRDATVEKWTP